MQTIERALDHTLRTVAAAGILSGSFAVKDGQTVNAQENSLDSGYELILDESIQNRDDAALAELGLELTNERLAFAATSVESYAAAATILEDNFEDASQGILTESANQRFKASYRDGQFVMEILDANWGGSPTIQIPGIFGNHSVKLDAALTPGSDPLRQLAFDFRRQEVSGTSGYRFFVDPRIGMGRIIRIDNGTIIPLRNEIKPDLFSQNRMNLVEFGGTDDRIFLNANGQEIASAFDNKYKEGKTFLRLTGTGPAEARIDNLSVSEETTSTKIFIEKLDSYAFLNTPDKTRIYNNEEQASFIWINEVLGAIYEKEDPELTKLALDFVRTPLGSNTREFRTIYLDPSFRWNGASRDPRTFGLFRPMLYLIFQHPVNPNRVISGITTRYDVFRDGRIDSKSPRAILSLLFAAREKQLYDNYLVNLTNEEFNPKELEKIVSTPGGHPTYVRNFSESFWYTMKDYERYFHETGQPPRGDAQPFSSLFAEWKNIEINNSSYEDVRAEWENIMRREFTPQFRVFAARN